MTIEAAALTTAANSGPVTGVIWHVSLMKNGASVPALPPFDSVHTAIHAGNAALRNGDADDVTIASREQEAIYYQFSTIRSSTEVLRIASMLELELVKATAAV